VLPQGGEHPPIQARPQQEIQQTTGEAERLVHFVLPPGYGGARKQKFVEEGVGERSKRPNIAG